MYLGMYEGMPIHGFIIYKVWDVYHCKINDIVRLIEEWREGREEGEGGERLQWRSLYMLNDILLYCDT